MRNKRYNVTILPFSQQNGRMTSLRWKVQLCCRIIHMHAVAGGGAECQYARQLWRLCEICNVENV